MAVDRLMPDFAPEDIYISTLKQYLPIAQNQLKRIPKKNFIWEPEKRDVGPAVALAMAHLIDNAANEPVVILWSDHMVSHDDKFRQLLSAASTIIKKEQNKIVFIGQKAKFASTNLGWISFDKTVKQVNKIDVKKFKGFKYRPDQETANNYFKSHNYCWNLGYFVSTPKFIYSLYKQFAPQIYKTIENIRKKINTPGYEKALIENYKKMPCINFDNSVIEQLATDSAYVIEEDIGWHDLGAWEALKTALEKNPQDNITKGKVLLEGCNNNLIYNYNDKKTVVAIDLSEFILINTSDVLLVTKKTSVSKIKQLVENLENSEYKNLI